MTRNERRAIAERGNPVAFVYFLNFLVGFFLQSDGVSPLAMARRPFRVTATIRKSQETRSQKHPLSTFPYVQNAPSVAQARLRGVLARRREGYFSDWSPCKYVYRHTSKKAQMYRSVHSLIHKKTRLENCVARSAAFFINFITLPIQLPATSRSHTFS